MLVEDLGGGSVARGEHGVVVAAVPWARGAARHTRAFHDVAAWCAVEMSASAASRLLRCSWRVIGSIVERVRRPSCRRRRPLRASPDPDRRDLIPTSPPLPIRRSRSRPQAAGARVDGANKTTLRGFFDTLGAERTAQLTHVNADGAPWLKAVISEKAPQAILCADPFHVVRWAMEALDEVRRRTWNEVRRGGRGRPAIGEGKRLKDSRWALWKKPESVTDDEQASLAYIAAPPSEPMHGGAADGWLRPVFRLSGEPAVAALTRWLGWAQRCQIPSFVRLAARINGYWKPIAATLRHGLTNALVESVNTKIRLIARRAFGFHNVNAVIGLAQLSLKGYRPQLPT